jgi:catechol 2,3-dioxygenase-like lactoylglutathione lyase family enzyme
MKKFLLANKIRIEKVEGTRDNYCAVIDPEGHRIAFAQPTQSVSASASSADMRIIHAGFVVHDRAGEDRFYKDILGFHVYWHGGMKKGEDNWVDMQVPDGTDWLEYMLNVPANADHHTLGVMNHVALGVPDIKAAREQLIKNGRSGTEQPKIGRDGKWQLNLYDPDNTRVELMEFTPTQKPCCSEYTGPHPGPKQ